MAHPKNGAVHEFGEVADVEGRLGASARGPGEVELAVLFFFFIMNGNCVSEGESEGGEDAGNGKLVPGNALFGDL